MRRGYPPRHNNLIGAEFDVWISHDMVFNNPPGQKIRTYKKYTKAKKIKYTKQVLRYLDGMEERRVRDGCVSEYRAVAIRLGDMIRYVWRNDLLSEEEYGEIQEKQKVGLGVLRKKFGRSMGKG